MESMNNKTTIVNTIVSSLSIIVTVISIIVVVPGFGIDSKSALEGLKEYTITFRVMALFILEAILAYGFGWLFQLVAYSSRNLNYRTDTIRFDNPPSFALNICFSFVSAWVTFFNVDILVASTQGHRIASLAIFGAPAILFGLYQLKNHVQQNTKCQYRPKELRYLLLLQGFAFLVMFSVFAFMEVLS